MIIAQSNSAGIVIGSPQAHFTWYFVPDFSFQINKFFFVLKKEKHFS